MRLTVRTDTIVEIWYKPVIVWIFNRSILTLEYNMLVLNIVGLTITQIHVTVLRLSFWWASVSSPKLSGYFLEESILLAPRTNTPSGKSAVTVWNKKNILSNYAIANHYLRGVLHEPGDVDADGEDEDEDGQHKATMSWNHHVRPDKSKNLGTQTFCNYSWILTLALDI